MSLAFVFPGQGSQSVGMMTRFARPLRRSSRRPLRKPPRCSATTCGGAARRGRRGAERDRVHPARDVDRGRRDLSAVARARRSGARAHGRPQPRGVQRAGRGRVPGFRAAVGSGEVSRRGHAGGGARRGRARMAAILGLEDGEVEAACAEAAQGEVVEAVNFNAPGQVVIAGTAAGGGPRHRGRHAPRVRGARCRCRSAFRRTAP